MTPALEFAMIGMKASMDQMQRTGEQMAQMLTDNTIVQHTVDLMTESHMYQSNATVVKSADELLGNLIDLFL